MKKKLYKDSPLNSLGQGVHDLLNYQDIKSASGQFDPVGESLFSLGEMFASKSWDGINFKKKEKVDSKAQLAKTKAKAKEVFGDVSTEGAFEDLTNPAAKKIQLGVLAPRPDRVVPVKKSIVQPNTSAFGTEWEVGKMRTYDDRVVDRPLSANDAGYDESFIPAGQETVSTGGVVPFGQTPTVPSFTPQQNSDLNAAGKSVFQRRKDDSPLERMNPEKLEALKGLMYNTSNGDSPLRRISHMMNSPFLKTDEGPDLEKVDFRYMKRATSTGIGSLGGAASAGYNLAIDAKNYETAVQQDYDEELSEGMGELVMDLDKTNPNYESDMFELASAKKKQYADGFAAYAAGDIDRLTWENMKMKMKGELENHGKSLNIIAELDKGFAEGKGSAFNTKASDERLTDYYNTRMKNPDAFTVKSIDGVDTYVGKTLQGKEVRLPISMIANGAAKMQLVPQYDVNKAVNQGLKVMKAFTVEGKTALGTGNRNLSQDNPEEAAQLREMAVDAISREIGGDETRLRSILADQRGLGFNEVEQLLNAEGGSRNENLQGLLKQMSEEIYDDKILDQGGYQAESKTRFRAQQPREARGSDRERAIAQTTAQLNQLPEFSEQSIGQYQSMIPANLKYRIVKDKKGQFGVVNSKGEPVMRLDPSDPEAVKTAIANLSGVKGYGTGGGSEDVYNAYLGTKK